MSTVVWVLAAIVGAVVLWFVLKVAAAVVFPPQFSGRAFIIGAAKKQGVDVSRIPQSAWDEIVESSIGASRALAAVSNNPIDKNWRANLVRFLDGEATTIATIMSGSKSPLSTGPTREILVRHGVIAQ